MKLNVVVPALPSFAETSLTDSVSSPVELFVGLGAPTVKSAALLSVSLPLAARLADVVFDGAGAGDPSESLAVPP